MSGETNKGFVESTVHWGHRLKPSLNCICSANEARWDVCHFICVMQVFESLWLTIDV